MTFLELESLEYKSKIKNDFDQGYDDKVSGKEHKKNASQQYKDGYKLGKGKQYG